jgi:MFS family permease
LPLADNPDMTLEPEPAPQLMNVRRATFYFALVYFSQGACQLPTLLNQPVRMYLEKVGHFDSQAISKFNFIALFPWVIKPLYGMLSDFFPLFGYRRKSYLLLLNLVAAVSFLLVAGVHSVQTLLIMVTITSVGVAASDVVVDAMMVQAGQQTGRTRLFQSAQWFSLSLAAILSGLTGSWICDRWSADPQNALRTAALIAMFVPLVVAVLTWFLVKDQRATINLPEFKATAKSLLLAFTNRRLWLVVVFLFLVNFNPGTQTPLYAHLEKKVGLEHSFLAILDTWFSVGQVLGALVFMVAMSGWLSTKWSTAIGLVAGAAGLLPMLVISGRYSASIAYATWGATAMMMMLSQLTVAAEACPKRVEAVVFAALMSVFNLSTQWSDVVGSTLYDGMLQQRMPPLILASAALTAAGLLFLPFLRSGNVEKEADAPARGFEVVTS